jgi:hypothetical protein
VRPLETQKHSLAQTSGSPVVLPPPKKEATPGKRHTGASYSAPLSMDLNFSVRFLFYTADAELNFRFGIKQNP